MVNRARRETVTLALLFAALVASALAPLVANLIAPALDLRPTAVSREATPIFGVAAKNGS